MTPNIQIGTVTQGASFNVTRTGTNENPILNFTLVKGDKGDVGQTGPTGPTGNGISSITKTATVGLVDTYTITYTNGNTTTFTVTNGEDGEVTETELNELRQQVEDLEDNQRTNTATGTEIYISDSAKAKNRSIGLTGRSTQDGEPTPENPVEIKSCGDNGSINEKIQTRNWFDVSKISQLIKNGTTTSNGITNIDNVITINKTNGQHGSYAMNYLMPIKSGKITVSFKALLSGTNSSAGILVTLYNSTATIYATTAQTKYASSKDKWLDYSATFELNQEAIDGIHLDIQAANTGNVIQIKDVQVELGSTATDYVPHEEQTYSIPLAKNIHFYKDAYFEKENNKWYVVNFYKYFEYPKISEMDSFTIREKTTLVSFYNLHMNLKVKTYNYDCMSNAFIPKDVYNTDQTGVFVHATSAGYAEYVYFGIPNELNLTTKQKAYDWLKENVTLLYPLEVPEKVEITDTTLINQLENLKNVKTYKGGTHIYSSNETPATVDIEYVVNVNTIYDRVTALENRINS